MPNICCSCNQSTNTVMTVNSWQCLSWARDLAESWVQCQLLTDTVWRVGCPELLYRSEVDHVISRLVGHTQPILPLLKRSECLRQHCLTPDTIHRNSVIHLTSVDYRIHKEVARTIGIFHWVTKAHQQQNILWVFCRSGICHVSR